MNYEIRLNGAEQDDGSIELDRLAILANCIQDVSKGALQIRLFGISKKRGRPNEKIAPLVKIRLRALKHGSTVLELECDEFSESISGVSEGINPSILAELAQLTPMSLVVKTFQEALTPDVDGNYLDKPLLKSLEEFKRVLINTDEIITISNQGSVPVLQLKSDDFERIKTLEASTPDPQQIIVNGKVELLQYSKSLVKIQTDTGIIEGYLEESIDSNSISKYWGKQITVSGTAYFKPNGSVSFMEVQQLYEPSSTDKYFSKIPSKENVEQQIQRQIKEPKYINHLSEIVGKWPGDESIDEILNSLD